MKTPEKSRMATLATLVASVLAAAPATAETDKADCFSAQNQTSGNCTKVLEAREDQEKAKPFPFDQYVSRIKAFLGKIEEAAMFIPYDKNNIIPRSRISIFPNENIGLYSKEEIILARLIRGLSGVTSNLLAELNSRGILTPSLPHPTATITSNSQFGGEVIAIRAQNSETFFVDRRGCLSREDSNGNGFTVCK